MTRSTTKVAVVNGVRMRLTRLDACGRIVYGDNNIAISKGFVSVKATTATTTTDAVEVKNANGERIVYEPEVVSFSNFGIEIEFAEVDPGLYALVTGQRVLYDGFGTVVGFTIDSAVSLQNQGIALEVWTGSPSGNACNTVGAQGSYGYVLFPFLQGGVIGDYTIAEGGIDFTIQGITSQDGNHWGAGPYNVQVQSSGLAGPLVNALTTTEHNAILIVGITPPDAVTGTRPQLNPSNPAITAISWAATSGHAGTLTFTGPAAATGVYVDFGDSTWDYITGTSTSHTYAAAGTYVVNASANGTYYKQTITVS